MRYNTLEIRWHDTKPIYSADFQASEATEHKRQLNPFQRTANNVSDGDGKLYRLATAGGDEKVRIWLTVPNPPLSAAPNGVNGSTGAHHASGASGPTKFGPPKAEYLATLDRHGATVNVVRFSPSGTLLASAGDDARSMGILLWKLAGRGPQSSFGARSDDTAFDRESWTAFRRIETDAAEIYDLAWSPDGQFLLAGGTKNEAYIYRIADHSCILTLKDHRDWVQGVTWDPLNKFIATQSRDRTVNVYSVESVPAADPRNATVRVKLISRNLKLVANPPTPAANGSSATVATAPAAAEAVSSAPYPSTPSTSSSAPAATSRNATSRPAAGPVSSQLMYGDEESTPFFRRLAFSPDGALLVTPAGMYDFPAGPSSSDPKANSSDSPARRDAPASSTSKSALKDKDKKKRALLTNTIESGPQPTTYVYGRGQLANETPLACLPGHKSYSIAVRFNPVLWKFKEGDKGKSRATEPETDQNGAADQMEVDAAAPSALHDAGTASPSVTMTPGQGTSADDAQAPPGGDSPRAFATTHRTIFAVATHDVVFVYDTQQTMPVAMMTNIHFAPLTDLAWTSDGLTLIATSADGYVSAFTFEEGELGEPSEEQPERPLSDLERVAIASTNLAAAGNATPVTQLTVTHRSSAATQEQHPSSTDTRDAPDSTNNPAATATTSSSSQGHASNSVPSASSGLQASGESDIILLDGPPPAPANGGEQEQKKVKKRAALNFVGPLQ